MILANTLAVAMFQRSLRREQPAGRAGYLRGLRLGLLIFVIGSLEGFVMIANLAHSVPRPDGGPGLPFVNWSTTGGDLRIAHFLALHALQLLPLAGFLLDRVWAAGPALRARVVSLGALAWAGVAALVTVAGGHGPALDRSIEAKRQEADVLKGGPIRALCTRA